MTQDSLSSGIMTRVDMYQSDPQMKLASVIKLKIYESKIFYLQGREQTRH